jgi:subtilisin family serine protease
MLAPFPQTGDPFIDGNPEKGANVLNNSWGCPLIEGCDPETYLPAVKALRDAGVFVVASAGNSGYGGCSTVEDPLAIYNDVYTVGAIDNTGNLADFSSTGPVTVDGSDRVKPDIVAPGVDILSSFPGSTYEQNSGTSMAGPHVVGVVALMWSANKALIGDIDRTREILNQTADQYTGRMPACVSGNGKPNNATGYGVVNAYNAVKQALEDGKKSQ